MACLSRGTVGLLNDPNIITWRVCPADALPEVDLVGSAAYRLRRFRCRCGGRVPVTCVAGRAIESVETWICEDAQTERLPPGGILGVNLADEIEHAF